MFVLLYVAYVFTRYYFMKIQRGRQTVINYNGYGNYPKTQYGKYPKTPKKMPKHPKTPKNNTKTPKNTQKHSKTPKNDPKRFCMFW